MMNSFLVTPLINHRRCFSVNITKLFESAFLYDISGKRLLDKTNILVVYKWQEKKSKKSVTSCKKYIYKQKQPSRDVPKKRCSENIQQIFRRTPIPKCDFNKVALHGCAAANLLHVFRTPFYKNTSGGPFLFINVARKKYRT